MVGPGTPRVILTDSLKGNLSCQQRDRTLNF